ncbi:MAG: glycosyltransferase family 1 protein [Pirellulales bacterium]
MKLLCYLQPHRGGGVARHAVEMSRGLHARQGFDVSFLASGADARRHPDFMGRLPRATMASLPLSGTLQERIWKVAHWPPLTRRCRGVDAIYSPAEVRFPACGVPQLVTIHDVQALEDELPWSSTPEHREFRRKWMRWLPKLIREADRILTVSEFSKQRMVDLLAAPADKIVVVGNGVSSAFLASSSMPPPETQPTVIVIGGLRDKKGAAATLVVAAEMRRRRLPFTIEVFGQHDPAWAIEAAAHPNVNLHGYAPDEVIADALRSSTALLFLSPYEGFGIPAVEAMAAGSPAVVANAASLPEIVGDAGLVVNPAEPQAVVDLLVRLMDDSAWRNVWVAKGRARAATFTWDRCVDKLVATLREVTA